MDRSERIRRCVIFYQMMRMIHDNMMLLCVLTLFVYFRNRRGGQLSLGGRVNTRIRRDALDRIIGEGDRNCIGELRMNTNAFANLCDLLQVNGEQEDQSPGMDDLANPTTNGSSQTKWATSSSEAAAASGRLSGKKRKQMDILERMVEHVQYSIEAQEKHVQILADAISGVNDKFKIGEKLEQLGFGDLEVVQVVMKFSNNPHLEKSFWGLTDSQKSALVRSILGTN